MNEDNTQDNSAPVVPSTEAARVVDDSTTDAAADTTGTPTVVAPAAAEATPAVGPSAGHHVPPTFSSQPQAPVAPQLAPVVQPTPPAAPQTPATAQGAAFGIHTTHTQPTVPLGAAGAPEGAPGATGTQGPKARSGVKVAGFVLAAALVGGIAGFGGTILGNALEGPRSSGVAQGPKTVTVNDPDTVNETTGAASKALPSVVTIDVAGTGDQGGSGSGVVISKDGYVLTNTHVVTLGGTVANPKIRVTASDGRIYDATVVGTDPIYDLAVIKLKDAKDLTPIDFADSSKLNVGDDTVALGAPLGLPNSVTTGIVSALNRSIQIKSSAVPESTGNSDQKSTEEQETPAPGEQKPFEFDLPGAGQQRAATQISIAVIQTDAAINHGNSGGALVNDKGELIGINVAIAGADSSDSQSGSIGIGFAIPSNIAQRIAKDIIADGAATHGLLGANVGDASNVEGATVSGAYISEVVGGGAAEKGGLAKGDVVTEFNGVPITNASDLTAQVRAAAAGSDAKLTYVRDGKQYDIEVKLGKLGS